MRDTFHYARVSFFGDSLTAGFDAESLAATYVSQAVTGLRALDAKAALTYASGNQYGGKVTDGIKQALSDLSHCPDLVVLQFGENDGPYTTTFREQYAALIAAVRRDGQRPLIAAFGVWDPHQDPNFIEMSQDIKQLALAENGVFVDITEASADPANRGAGRNVGWLNSSGHELSDTFHPNDLGHAAMAAALLEAVANHIVHGPARLAAKAREPAAVRPFAEREMV
jgi:lysophospholipase L1-like esterase